ncbi:hypothetical protein ACJX0J_011695, partial [Zea mays]
MELLLPTVIISRKYFIPCSIFIIRKKKKVIDKESLLSYKQHVNYKSLKSNHAHADREIEIVQTFLHPIWTANAAAWILGFILHFDICWMRNNFIHYCSPVAVRTTDADAREAIATTTDSIQLHRI